MKKLLADKRLLIIIIALVLVLLLVNFNQRMVLLSKLRGQEKILATNYSELEATRSALQTQIAQADSDAAVEKWAREEASMIQEGDVPIVLLPPADAPHSTPTPFPPIIEKVSKWEIWRELFFGN